MSKAAFDSCRHRLASLPLEKLDVPSVDPELAAAAGFRILDLLGTPETMDALAALAAGKVFDASAPARLMTAAGALHYAAVELAQAPMDAVAVDEEWLRAARLLQRTMVTVLEDRADLLPELFGICAYVRLGRRPLELSQNLVVLADAYRDHEALLESSWATFSPDDGEEARRLSRVILQGLSAAWRPLTRDAFAWVQRAWPDFVVAYGPMAAVARFLLHQDRPLLLAPSLVDVGSRSRRKAQIDLLAMRRTKAADAGALKEEIFEVDPDELLPEEQAGVGLFTARKGDAGAGDEGPTLRPGEMRVQVRFGAAGAGSEVTIGTTEVLTEKGFFVTSHVPWPQGRRLEFILSSPFLMAPFTVKGVVRRVRHGNMKKGLSGGMEVELTDMDDGQRRELRGILQQLSAAQADAAP